MTKICVITATRAEYGLLNPLMKQLQFHERFKLQVLVTGAHLSPEFGLTYRGIEEDGFEIDKKVEMLLSSDTDTAITKSMGLGLIGFADAFTELRPDAIIILGDRYEMLSIASAASIFKIPIIHLHGGEITEGAYDDAFRHAITKLSQLHFTSTEEYKNRVIQMGEQPSWVFNVGAIGIDNILNKKLLSQKDLEVNLGIKFKKYNYQVTFHPETLGEIDVESQFKILLNAIERQSDGSFFVFTKSNADTDGRVINRMIDEFVSNNSTKAIAFKSLGSLRFLSLVKVCDAIIGNSSSGIIEAPSLQTQTINIGDRQKGRIQSDSVINTRVEVEAISQAILNTQQEKISMEIKEILNPYGQGHTTNKIMDVLEHINFKKLRTKSFYTIKHKNG